MQRIAYVTVTIPVNLDSDVPIQRAVWWKEAAVENFLDHPALDSPATLSGYVDKVVFGACEACGGKGWLVMDEDHTGNLRIERCDTCEQFDCDNSAVGYVARLASGQTRSLDDLP